jgi:hypothetical protein
MSIPIRVIQGKPALNFITTGYLGLEIIISGSIIGAWQKQGFETVEHWIRYPALTFLPLFFGRFLVGGD